jgi:RecB family exonuclease
MLDRAMSAFDAIAAQPGSSPSVMLREVPFSLRRPDGTIVRGAIDAVAEHPDGSIEVIEFKTGQRREDHRDQLAVYIEAARVFFPDRVISGRFIYAREGQLSDSSGV